MKQTEINFDSILSQAADEDKRIFLYFGAEWCPPCKLMKSNVFKNNDVIEALENYVVTIVDTDDNRDLAMEYQIAGVPAFMIVDPDGSVIKKHSGFLPEDQMIKWLLN